MGIAIQFKTQTWRMVFGTSGSWMSLRISVKVMTSFSEPQLVICLLKVISLKKNEQ